MFGYEISPFNITRRVHEHAHADAMSFMNAKQQNIFLAAMMRDKKDGEKAWAANEIKKGKSYARQMGNAFYKNLAKIKKLGSQTIDRNEDFIAFKEEFDSKFKELSNTARVAATYTFLRGYMKLSDNVKRVHKSANFPEAMPPTSKTKGEYSLLSPTVMSYFFQAYNQSVTSNRNTDSLAKLPAGKNLEETIRGVCGKK
jgi:hypothetical protein